MTSKCPKCEKLLTRLNLETVDGSSGVGSSVWKTVVLSCPFCATAISAQIDPIAIMAETVKKVASMLRAQT